MCTAFCTTLTVLNWFPDSQGTGRELWASFPQYVLHATPLITAAHSYAANFANAQLCDRIKLMAADPMTDDHVKKRLIALLASWHRLWQDDPKMKTVADLYLACGGGKGKAVHVSIC